MRHAPGDGRYVTLCCTALGGLIAGWSLPAPASWLGILMTAISIGGMAVISSDLVAKIRKEERKQLRRNVQERSREHRDQ
ncbi:hypothetical protein ABZ419_02615 [Streptomyces cinnamoneus]|uniref:hypothetical protein n=1 Tax=Streptomyces cinnamoneus TaxID=53446 RepID=UPI0033FACDD0